MKFERQQNKIFGNKDISLYNHASGAKLLLVKNSSTNDKNYTFTISFKTPATNSKGTAHVLEHCLLTGSKKYKTKDMFSELLKGSVNTYLNAITFPDKTVYAFSSYNFKDFTNILDVFLDGIFNPLFFERKGLFLQEAVNFTTNEHNDEVEISGIVFNEMTEHFSDITENLKYFAKKEVFKNDVRGNFSAGFPSEIANLTFEEVVSYYKKYYKFKYAKFYLSGDFEDNEVKKIINNIEHYCKSEFDYEENFSKLYDDKKYNIFEKDFNKLNFNNKNNITNTNKRYAFLQMFCLKNYNFKDVTTIKLLVEYLNEIFNCEIECEKANKIVIEFEEFSTSPTLCFTSNAQKNLSNFIKNELNKIASGNLKENILQKCANKLIFEFEEAKHPYRCSGLMDFFGTIDNWAYNESPYEFFSKKEYIKEISISENFSQIISRIFSADVVETSFFVEEKKLIELINKAKENARNKNKNEIEVDNITLTKYLNRTYSNETLIPKVTLSEILFEHNKKQKKLNYEKEINNGEFSILFDETSSNFTYFNLFFEIKNANNFNAKLVALIKKYFEYFGKDIFNSSSKTNEYANFECLVKNIRNCANNNCSLYFIIKISAYKKNENNTIQKLIKLIRKICKINFEDFHAFLSKLLINNGEKIKTNLQINDKKEIVREVLSKLNCEFYYEKTVNDFNFFEENLENCKNIYENYIQVANEIFSCENLIINCSFNKLKKIEQFKTLVKQSKQRKNSNNLNKKYDASIKLLNNKFKIENTFKETDETEKTLKHITNSIVNKTSVAYAVEIKKNLIIDSFTLKLIVNILNGYLYNEVRVKNGAYEANSMLVNNNVIVMFSASDPLPNKTIEIFENSLNDGLYNYIRKLTKLEFERYIIGTVNICIKPLHESDAIFENAVNNLSKNKENNFNNIITQEKLLTLIKGNIC